MTRKNPRRATLVGSAAPSVPSVPKQGIARAGMGSHMNGTLLFRAMTRSGEPSRHALSARSVNLVVKRRVEQVGLNPDRYGAHSLRSGMATEAARNGASERHIMRQTRHRSLKVLRSYIDDGGTFRENAAKLLGL